MLFCNLRHSAFYSKFGNLRNSSILYTEFPNSIELFILKTLLEYTQELFSVDNN